MILLRVFDKLEGKYLEIRRKRDQIYLFGSRLDDSKKGGDIDLFIVSKDIDYEKKLKIRAKLKALLKKPVDVVYHKDFNREIEIEVLKGRLL